MDMPAIGRKARIRATTFLLMLAIISGGDSALAEQGTYFAKKQYRRQPLPTFAAAKAKLPSPIFDEDPDFIRCYWKAWELAFKNFHEPAQDSGFVSQFIDAAFNQNIFLWDTCFMTMFCNYAHPYVPGICSLDNFYARQHEDGEICREIHRTTGVDFEQWVNADEESLFSRWGYALDEGTERVDVIYEGRPAPVPHPKLTLDALNHPILAWAELESFQLTADKDRLQLVWEPLCRYYGALQEYLRQGNGLYMTDWASMDNATRNEYLKRGGTGIDISCEMVLFAHNLAEMAVILDKETEARRYGRDAKELSVLINRHMWDDHRGFYFDLTLEGERAPVKSIGAFWSLLSQVASQSQAEALAAELKDPETFNTLHRVPTLAANEPGFDPAGGYWRGAVWAPTNKMVIAGLEKYGYADLAAEIALNHLDSLVAVFKETGTVWENYAPQQIAPGKPAKGDFVGWTGIGPIALFIEYAIGIRVNAPANVLAWKVSSRHRVGIDNFWFGGKTVSLLCEEADETGHRDLRVRSNGAFDLTVLCEGRTKTFEIPANRQIELRL